MEEPAYLVSRVEYRLKWLQGSSAPLLHINYLDHTYYSASESGQQYAH
uniref:Uncharacterized protein n=1 Tax=Arundo donax TaxID=35708 RepID=A0A0A8Y426_ARUDO